MAPASCCACRLAAAHALGLRVAESICLQHHGLWSGRLCPTWTVRVQDHSFDPVARSTESLLVSFLSALLRPERLHDMHSCGELAFSVSSQLHWFQGEAGVAPQASPCVSGLAGTSSPKYFMKVWSHCAGPAVILPSHGCRWQQSPFLYLLSRGPRVLFGTACLPLTCLAVLLLKAVSLWGG